VSTDTPADSPLIAGRYRLDRVLGAGGAAVVHEGYDLDTGDRVAVKVYRPDGSGHPTQHHRELKALTTLRHPGLVALLDSGTEPGPDGRTYVVTDLVEGPSLARRLDSGPLSADEVRVLAIGLGDALAHVHAHGFVHRDVKPANILLEHGHEPRLADFGIARALDGTVYTATGAVAGTAAYLAPEQVRGETVDPSVDVFALGLVLIEALTGEREYPGTLAESAAARLHRSPVVPEGLPPDLAAVLAAMTARDPAARPTAAAVVSALSTQEIALPAPARRRGFAWGARAALAAAVVLVALVGGAVLLFGRTAASTPTVPVPSMSGPASGAPSPSVPQEILAAPAEPVALPAVANAAVAVPATEIAAADRAAPRAGRAADNGGSPPSPAKAAPPAVAEPVAEPVNEPVNEPAEKAKGKDKGKGAEKSGNGNNGSGNSGKGKDNGQGQDSGGDEG
jgi:eukaryotic-like serine/threonine-protein kinase